MEPAFQIFHSECRRYLNLTLAQRIACLTFISVSLVGLKVELCKIEQTEFFGAYTFTA